METVFCALIIIQSKKIPQQEPNACAFPSHNMVSVLFTAISRPTPTLADHSHYVCVYVLLHGQHIESCCCWCSFVLSQWNKLPCFYIIKLECICLNVISLLFVVAQTHNGSIALISESIFHISCGRFWGWKFVQLWDNFESLTVGKGHLIDLLYDVDEIKFQAKER